MNEHQIFSSSRQRQRPRKYGAYQREKGGKHIRWRRCWSILSGSKAQMVKDFKGWLESAGELTERAIRPIPHTPRVKEI